MIRGTFANGRIRNHLAAGTEGGVTVHLPDGEPMSIYDAAVRYRDEGVPLIVLAGKEYGSGSSRDWAAKGTALLGVRAVLAESFERIHRSNLIGMGVLPLQYVDGRVGGNARPHRPRAVRPDRRRRVGAVAVGDRPSRRPRVPGRGAHRHRDGARLLPPRRHPAVRAAVARQLIRCRWRTDAIAPTATRRAVPRVWSGGRRRRWHRGRDDRPDGLGDGSWVAAYLVLVLGVAQIGLGTGQVLLAVELPARRAVRCSSPCGTRPPPW